MSASRDSCKIVYAPVIVYFNPRAYSAYTAIAFAYDIYHTNIAIPLKTARGVAHLKSVTSYLNLIADLYLDNLKKTIGRSTPIKYSLVNQVQQPVCPRSVILYKITGRNVVEVTAIGGDRQEVAQLVGAAAPSITTMSTFALGTVNVQIHVNVQDTIAFLQTVTGLPVTTE